MRKALALLFCSVAFAAPAFADWTGKDASGATITFKNPNVCSSVVCVPISSLVDSTGAAVGTAGAPLRIDPTGTTTQPVSLTSTTITGTVAATQSGAWTVNPTTIGNWGLSASTYNTATPTNAALVEGQFLTAPGTMTSGNSAPLQIDANGNLRVNVMTGGGAGGTSSSFGSAFPGTGTAIGLTSGTNMVAWSATTNYGTAPAAIAVPAVNAYVTNTSQGRTTSALSSPIVPSAAPTTFHLIAAASTNATSVKASAATLMSCQTSNNSTTAGYLKVYNKASAPTVGTDVPVFTGIIPGPAAGGGGNNINFGPGGLALATGFALAVTGVITDADTTAVAATTFAINCQYE